MAQERTPMHLKAQVIETRLMTRHDPQHCSSESPISPCLTCPTYTPYLAYANEPGKNNHNFDSRTYSLKKNTRTSNGNNDHHITINSA